MKNLFMLVAFFVFLQNATAQTTVPQCTVLSISHFGGDKDDDVSPVPQLNNGVNDSTFRVAISTLSTTGNINVNCSTGAYFQIYDANTLTVINETCIPIGTNFQRPAFYLFPQANGDSILIGQSNDSHGNYGIECRNSAGNVLWTKSYGGSAQDGFYSAVPAPDGSGFFINGGSLSNDGDVGLHYGDQFHADIWIIRVDNDGNLLWSKVIGGTYIDGIEDMIATDEGGLYLFGETNSYDHDMSGNHSHEGDVYVAKLDSLGNIEWHHCYGGIGSDGGPHIHALKDHHGGFYIAANTESSDGDVQRRPAMAFDFWLLHIDSAGNLLWENTYGGPSDNAIYDMCRATDGSIWIGGSAEGGDNPAYVVGGDIAYGYGWKDAWVVHVDTLGDLINSCVMGNYGDDYLRLLQPLPDGNVLAGGTFSHIRADTDTAPASPGFPKYTYGDDWADQDIFLAKISPDNDLAIDKQEAGLSDWNLYPNPAQQAFTIEIKNNNRKFHITVTDGQGRRVYRDKFKSKITVPTLSWSPGMYWVTISQGNHSDTKKLIIKK